MFSVLFIHSCETEVLFTSYIAHLQSDINEPEVAGTRQTIKFYRLWTYNFIFTCLLFQLPFRKRNLRFLVVL